MDTQQHLRGAWYATGGIVLIAFTTVGLFLLGKDSMLVAAACKIL
jgi:hypothetical protein